MRILTKDAADDIAKLAGGDCWFELMDINLGADLSGIVAEWQKASKADAALLKHRLLKHDIQTEYQSASARETFSFHLLLTNADVPVLEDAPCVTPEMAEADASINDLDYWQQVYYPLDMTYSGKLHWPTPYSRDSSAQAQGADGAQTMQVRIGDPSGALWRLVESANGLRGCTATLSLARLKEYPWKHGADGEPMVIPTEEVTGGAVTGKFVTAARAWPAEVSVEYAIRSCSTDGTRFVFSLANDSPFSRQWPPRRMYKAQCRWVFKSPECGYTGNDTSCDRTIAACRAKNNISRIGCFPGCGTGGLAQ